MIRSLSLLMLLLASTAKAQVDPHICAQVDLVESNVATFDPEVFGPGPDIDVYHVRILNPLDEDVTSIELSLLGDFVNNQQGGLTFKGDAALPLLGPNLVAETFFVIENELSVNTVDEGGVLSASYTISGGGVIVPAGGEAVVAVLSLPTGSQFDGALASGRAAVGGRFESIPFLSLHCVPEPSTACLVALLVLGLPKQRG